MRGEPGDPGLVQLSDQLQPPAPHQQRLDQLPHLLLTQAGHHHCDNEHYKL